MKHVTRVGSFVDAILNIIVRPESFACGARLTMARLCELSIVLLFAIGLTACGWHLQGASRLPDSMLKIRLVSVDAYSDFHRELRQSLIASGAQLDGPISTTQAVVRIHSDKFGQRVLSISARNTPEEYEVFYAIDYSVDAGGKEVIERQRLELTANYSFDPTAVLAKQKEQAIMQQALARELAGLVLRRLGTVSPAGASSTESPSRSSEVPINPPSSVSPSP